jgi:HEAT repeat protein
MIIVIAFPRDAPGPRGSIRPDVCCSSLIAALKDQDELVRLTAAGGLGEIGPEAKEVVPDLRAALKDRGKYVRDLVAAALRKIAP